MHLLLEFRKEILGWPIDYEVYSLSDSELEETLGDWFGSNKWSKSGHSFLQFGQDGTGSLFCLWFYPELKHELPVVFLGSEGESCLVSSNTTDFVKQLTSGKLFYDGDWLEPEPEDESELNWNELKIKTMEYLGAINNTPEEIKEKAIKEHPGFSTWVESKVDY